MFKRTIAAALVVGAATVAPPAVMAQDYCAPRELVVERLKEQYSERLTGGGLRDSDTLLEVWSSDKTGSFTVLMTTANGITCVMASGENWTTVTQTAISQDRAG